MRQVICWVLGEYGTADGKYSASYITGKLCDVAEAHPEDDTVKVCILYVKLCSICYGASATTGKKKSIVVTLLHTVQILVYYSLGLRTWDCQSLP